MSALPIVIDDIVRARMREIVALANERPIPLEIIRLLAAGEPMPKGLHNDFTMVVPMGFPVIYTHEVQPSGIFRHMSMSVALDRVDRVPHPLAVQMVMEEMGFINDLGHCKFWHESVGGCRTAINVLEPLDGNWDAVPKLPRKS